MSKQRVLITVKTYPTLSTKYGETVCTAGVREDGSWVRIYPVPFRRLDEAEQYKKFDWVECNLIPSTKDPRPETHHPVDLSEMITAGNMNTADEWRERRRLLLEQCPVFTSMTKLISLAKDNEASLAIFRPTEILGFVWEEEEPEWDENKMQAMRAMASQGDLFEEEWRKTFRVIPKLPYSFSYRFLDDEGKKRKLQILDWEIGALFWKCRRNASGDEAVALAKVQNKYLENFASKDLHFILGTTQQWHSVATNPWVIIGVLPFPHVTQPHLF